MGNYDPQEMAEKIMEAIKKARDNMTTLNIMVMGKTGVGKSTLINNVFSEQLAETGIGKPVTSKIRRYEKPGFPLAIYDTPGLELEGENAVETLLNEVVEVIEEGIRSGDVSKAIHCIWYCVSTTSHRFEEAEISFINKFLEETKKYKVPVIMVLTQSYSKKEAKELKAVIENENLNVSHIVPVLAADYEIDDDYIAKAFGLDMLTQAVDTVIPDVVKNTLVAVQKVNLELKTNKAHVVVATSAAAAAATGAIPIPFSDAAALVPEQIAMLASITAVFGLPVEKGTLSTILSATIGAAGATVLGKTIVAGILKLIPGAGSVAGGVISGSTAAALTAALGEAYIGVLTLIIKGDMNLADLETEKGKEMISQMFKQRLSLRRTAEGAEEE